LVEVRGLEPLTS